MTPTQPTAEIALAKLDRMNIRGLIGACEATNDGRLKVIVHVGETRYDISVKRKTRKAK
jgi:hypothetical protein